MPDFKKRLKDSQGLPLSSLKEISYLPQEAKSQVLGALIPQAVSRKLALALDAQGAVLTPDERVQIIAPSGLGVVRIEVRRQPQDHDCVFFLELADTPFGQLELSFCIINDPDSPRYNIDYDIYGRSNDFGTTRRNLEAEKAAMEAGLSPHQIRPGLRGFRDFFERFEAFVAAMGMQTIVAEPLSYCNAIRYESYGFDYIYGKQLMHWIHSAFQPSGCLYQRLDSSTPFRQPGMAGSVRGRSWAIHDGILDQPWDDIKIYKSVGKHAGVETFPPPRIWEWPPGVRHV